MFPSIQKNDNKNKNHKNKAIDTVCMLLEEY